MDPKRIGALKSVANRGGTENERESARRILDEAGIDWKEEEVAKTWVKVTHKNAFEKKLAIQTYFSLFPDDNEVPVAMQSQKSTELQIAVTHVSLFQEKFKMILSDYRGQLALFQSAFIHKNQLFGNPKDDDDDSPPKYTDEELKKIALMMMTVDRTSIEKKLNR